MKRNSEEISYGIYSKKPILSRTMLYGDNIKWLPIIKTESIDAVITDPPFFTGEIYNNIFREKTGAISTAQKRAYDDIWRWNTSSEQNFKTLIEHDLTSTTLSEYFKSADTWMGKTGRLSYLTWITLRFLEIHRVLKQTGSFYTMCDNNAVHDLRTVLDIIFGRNNFRGTLIWRSTGSHNSVTRNYGNVTEYILYYTKSDNYTFNIQYTPHTKESMKQFEKTGYGKNSLTGAGKTKKGTSSKPWRDYDPYPRHWAIPKSLKHLFPPEYMLWTSQQKLDFLDNLGYIIHPQKGSKSLPQYKQTPSQGVPYNNLWVYIPGTKGCLVDGSSIGEDVKFISRRDTSKRTGYETEKPVGLMKRIIEVSSNKGDVILDPFCGCGPVIEASEETQRNWIGIDLTYLAIGVIKNRLENKFTDLFFSGIKIMGSPEDYESALYLSNTNKDDFEAWGRDIFGYKQPERDGGADGVKIISDRDNIQHRCILEVKGGEIVLERLRSFSRAIDAKKAHVGIFFTLKKPTYGMLNENTELVKSIHTGEDIPKLQIITVDEYFSGKRPKY